MRELILKLFSEHTSELEINLFDFWHFTYLFIIFGGTALLAFFFHKKDQEIRQRILRTFVLLTIGFYVADFFIMPLSDSYNGISTDKLPFHICTLMGVLAPFVQYNKRFAPIKPTVVALSITASLM